MNFCSNHYAFIPLSALHTQSTKWEKGGYFVKICISMVTTQSTVGGGGGGMCRGGGGCICFANFIQTIIQYGYSHVIAVNLKACLSLVCVFGCSTNIFLRIVCVCVCVCGGGGVPLPQIITNNFLLPISEHGE